MIPNNKHITYISLAAGLFFALVGWLFLNQIRDTQYQQLLESQAERISTFLVAEIKELESALQRQARRWERLDTRQHASFIRDAEDYAEDFKAIKGIALADKSAVIETIIPLEGNEKAVGFSLMSEARRAEMIRRAISTQTLAISKPIEFVQGDMGFLIAIPLYKNNQLEGFLSTAVSQQVLMNNAKQQFAAVFDTLDLSISIEDQIIYKTKNFDIRMQDAQQHLKTSFVNFIGINEAKVDLISSPSFKQNQNIQFPEYYAALVFIVCFLMTHSLSLLVQFRRQTRLLSKALDDAKASEKAKDLFLSNMSHELRTPLNGIYGALQLLTGSNDTEKSLLVVAKHSTEALNTLVSDILDIQRLSEGNVQLTPAWHRPADIFRRVEHLHNIQARTKGLDLHIMLAEELPDEIYCDEVRLSQILNNIIGNAVKFTHEGFVKVEAHYNEHALRISVSDTGIGMHHQLFEQIFERFSQADTSTTRQFGGTGLGMAITKELISLMHGDIAVQSLLGKGSSFTVTLPLEGRSSHSASEVQPPPTFSLRNLRVLLVDDVATNTLVGAAVLRQHVGQVETASSGKEALEILNRQSFDLLVTDIGMPNMSGEELKTIVNKNYPFMAVIALTGNVSARDIQHYQSIGFDGVATKPLQADKFIELVQHLLAHQSLATPEASQAHDSLRL